MERSPLLPRTALALAATAALIAPAAVAYGAERPRGRRPRPGV
nr:hypothetical protein [Streptomyces antimycoticus]